MTEDWHSRMMKRRKQLDMSRSLFARKVGVAPPTVQDWEDGRIKRITGANTLKVSEVLQCTPEWLINGEGEDPTGVASPLQNDELSNLLRAASAERAAELAEPLRLLITAPNHSFQVVKDVIYLITTNRKVNNVTGNDIVAVLEEFFKTK